MERAEISERANQARNLALGLLSTAVMDLVPPKVSKPDWMPSDDGRQRRKWQSEMDAYREEQLYHQQAQVFIFEGDPILTKSGRRLSCDDLLAELDINPSIFRKMAKEDPEKLGKAMFDAVHYAPEVRRPAIGSADNDADSDAPARSAPARKRKP